MQTFVLDGYVRGWGLSGAQVDLDVGTAIFARRTDVTRWNGSCVQQIERTFGEKCDAVDVHGYNPDACITPGDTTSKYSDSSGMQAPFTLTLRTCAEHWMRVIVLRKEDPTKGWVNGT